MSPCDAKRVLSLYGKRVVKKVIAGCVVGISAIECIGENEAKARGLMNSSSGKRNDYTNIDATQIDLRKKILYVLPWEVANHEKTLGTGQKRRFQ